MGYNAPPNPKAMTPNADVGGGLLWVGMLAIVGACSIVLVQGVGAGWAAARMILYVTLALVLMGLVLSQRAHWRAVSPLLDRAWVYLLLTGLVCFALQVASGDPFVQPIVFTVPLVSAVLCFPALRAVLVGLVHLALLALGLWLGGMHDGATLVAALGIYAFIMLTLGVFTYQAVRQAAARRQVAELAATLERERDYLARLVAENACLYEQAQRSATLAERNRIARELHDTIAQGLTAVTMQLEAAQRSFDRDAGRTRARLGRAHALARETLDDVRRSVWTLAEPLIEARDLQPALQALAQHFQARTGVPASYQHAGAPPPVDSAAATQVARMVREALQNVEKHAQANSVTIVSEVTDDAMLVRVCDDGVGFTLAANKHAAGQGFGLMSLHERARLAGGIVDVQSAPGEGTCVFIRIASHSPVERMA